MERPPLYSGSVWLRKDGTLVGEVASVMYGFWATGLTGLNMSSFFDWLLSKLAVPYGELLIVGAAGCASWEACVGCASPLPKVFDGCEPKERPVEPVPVEPRLKVAGWLAVDVPNRPPVDGVVVVPKIDC
ncbi:hypothetical protein BpHYR1_016239 [Brachionus plicatilis]|uniref:Uncharacterized protein n=1 Tax=Brachionus plicatilis TaxID=10195 RepID=A0A3M7RIC5_BRAPC|nr:hypothetical protein BpHYR1_016239 [Brachionus plicatilis]